MVRIMRICREWFKVIDEDTSLWRKLVLETKPKGRGAPRPSWKPEIEIIHLFDRKCNSRLIRVEVYDEISPIGVSSLMEVLEKSKETLQILDLNVRSFSHAQRVELDELCWRLPHLIHCNLASRESLVQLVEKIDDHLGRMSKLESLSIFNAKKLSNSHPNILNNLVALRISSSMKHVDSRRILEIPSKTLKYLRLYFKSAEPAGLTPLEFPRLQCLRISSLLHFQYPTWLKIPSDCTLIIPYSLIPSTLPSASRLWISDPDRLENLKDLCPLLKELKIHPYSQLPKVTHRLINMLKKRRENVEAGVEVNGIRMIPLETLVVDCQHLKPHVISELRELVGEVKSVETVPSSYEVEI